MIPKHLQVFSDKGRGFFIHLRTGDLYRLNAAGVRIFEALQAGVDIAKLPGILASEFDVGYEQARLDIDEFFEQLSALEQ